MAEEGTKPVVERRSVASGEYSFWPSPTAWTTPVLVTIAFLTGMAVAPNSGSQAFYEASAQVIPVIMLTLAIEARAFEWRLEWRGWRDRYNRGLDGHVMVAGTGVIVLLCLVVAQVITMVELSGTAFRSPGPTFVFAAMVAGLAAVILVAVPGGGRGSSPPG